MGTLCECLRRYLIGTQAHRYPLSFARDAVGSRALPLICFKGGRVGGSSNGPATRM